MHHALFMGDARARNGQLYDRLHVVMTMDDDLRRTLAAIEDTYREDPMERWLKNMPGERAASAPGAATSAMDVDTAAAWEQWLWAHLQIYVEEQIIPVVGWALGKKGGLYPRRIPFR
jgi:hypothetical protein